MVVDWALQILANPQEKTMSSEAKCPFPHAARTGTGVHAQAAAGAPSNADWWPNQLNLGILHQHAITPRRSNPLTSTRWCKTCTP
jgi:catalase (peroxidase I)